MPHTREWDESAPPNVQAVALGAQRIRELKVDIQERMQVDHVWDVDQNVDGFHKQVTMAESASDPTASPTYGILYTKNDSGSTHLFYRASDGTVRQLTGTMSNISVPWALITGTPAFISLLESLGDPGFDAFLYWDDAAGEWAFTPVTPNAGSGWIEAGAVSADLPSGWSVSIEDNRYRVTHNLDLNDPTKLRVVPTYINDGGDTDLKPFIETINKDYFDIAVWDQSDGHIQTDVDIMFLYQIVP